MKKADWTPHPIRLIWSFRVVLNDRSSTAFDKGKQAMTTKYFDNSSSVLSSTEIRVYKDYLDAPPISGVYIFEVEKGLVKCGMSRNVEKRFSQLVDIKKHREAPSGGRAAILPVDEERLKRVESAFFALLRGNIDGTELFKISFERALKDLRKLYENNPPSMFHLTDEEKAEAKLKQLKAEKALKNAIGAVGLDKAIIRDKYARNRVSLELGVSSLFSAFLELFPESVDALSFERFIGEYRHYLHLVSMLLSPVVWEEDFGKLRLDDVTAGRIGALALRLHSVTFTYEDVLKSHIPPRRVVYHAANLVTILRDINNLYSELIEVAEKFEDGYPDGVESIFKEARDRAGYFSRYLIARFAVTSCPEQDVSWFRDELHSMGKRLHKLLKEEMRTVE